MLPRYGGSSPQPLSDPLPCDCGRKTCFDLCLYLLLYLILICCDEQLFGTFKSKLLDSLKKNKKTKCLFSYRKPIRRKWLWIYEQMGTSVFFFFLSSNPKTAFVCVSRLKWLREVEKGIKCLIEELQLKRFFDPKEGHQGLLRQRRHSGVAPRWRLSATFEVSTEQSANQTASIWRYRFGPGIDSPVFNLYPPHPTTLLPPLRLRLWVLWGGQICCLPELPERQRHDQRKA